MYSSKQGWTKVIQLYSLLDKYHSKERNKHSYPHIIVLLQGWLWHKKKKKHECGYDIKSSQNSPCHSYIQNPGICLIYH